MADTGGARDLSGRMETIAGWSKRIEATVSRPPSLRARLIASLVLGLFGAAIVHFEYSANPGAHSDFGMVWFGGKSLLEGRNPYELIGPGREFDYRWPLIYPGTALVAVLPLSLLSEHAAAVVFVFASAAALAFGATRTGWYLVPLFATEPFVSAARLGQWSILLSAALFFPSLSSLAAVKPQTSIPILLASKDAKPFVWAGVGTLLLLTVSMILLPEWPAHWLEGVRAAENMEPPIARFGGWLIPLVLIRWRRPESWLILSLACMPQSWGWYGTLPLFLIPKTLNESLVMTGAATFGAYIGAMLVPEGANAQAFYAWVGSMIVITIYLPAVALVLRRPNKGPVTVWLKRIGRSR